MTDGITEAMRDDDGPPPARRVWRVAVDGDEVQRRIEVVGFNASDALDSARRRGVFDGAEVTSITVVEVGDPKEQR